MIDAPSLSHRRGFVRRWIVLVAIGEATGFAVATAAAILTIVLKVDDVVRLPIVMLGGAIEGAAFATGQYLAMQQNRPSKARWIGVTAAAASIAWLLGMLPSTLGLGIYSVGTIVLIAFGAIVLLASIPFAQWIALDRRGAFRWVPINMVAWLVAILWTAAPSPFVDEATPVPVIASLYVVAGLLMAVTVAVLTAPVARSLFSAPVAQPKAELR